MDQISLTIEKCWKIQLLQAYIIIIISSSSIVFTIHRKINGQGILHAGVGENDKYAQIFCWITWGRDLGRGAQILQKPKSHIEILRTRKEKWTKFHTEDP